MNNENNLNEKTMDTTNPSVIPNNNGAPNPSVMPNNNGAPNPSVMPNNNGTPDSSVMPNNNGAPNPSVMPNNNGIPNLGVIPNSNTNTEDDDLLKAFTGKNSDKILAGNFNFAAFFSGSIYFFYRKMYLYGVILFIIEMILSNLLKSQLITIVIGLMLSFIVGLKTNQLYVNHARKKIRKIKKNGTSNEEIKSNCIKKGGTSIASAILFVVTVIIIFVVISILATFILYNQWTYLRKNVDETDIYSYISRAEVELLIKSAEISTNITGTCSINENILSCNNNGSIVDIEIDFVHVVPESGTLIVENKKVIEGKDLVVNNYICDYKNSKVTCKKNN